MNYELRCRECGKSWGNQPKSICDDCFSPLEVSYDYDAVRIKFTREKLPSARQTCGATRSYCLSRQDYHAQSARRLHSAVQAPHLASENWRHAALHQERCGLPSNAELQRSRGGGGAGARRSAFGFDTVACSSTGNLANSVAAQAARNGFKAWIFIPADLEPAKILGTQVYGAKWCGLPAATTR